MAVVYKATHRNQAEFAIKMLHPEFSMREDIRSRFLREGYAANSVKHSGAVLVVDDDVAEDGAAFLVMELLRGAPVDEIWEKRCNSRMAPRLAIAIGYQLLDVLAAAHEKGIVHRDIKPPNLFLTKEGVLKVLDFGIARVRDAMTTGAQVTGTGMLLGTPAFMAPEQAMAKSSEIDGKTDVWDAGATLFTLLSGQIVHPGENAPQVMIRAATVRARPLQSVVLEVPAELADIVDRALAFEKDARPTAAAMRDALEQCYDKLYGEPISVAPLAALMRSEGAPPAGLASRPLTPDVVEATVAMPIAANHGPPALGVAPLEPPRIVGATTAQPVSSGRGTTVGVPRSPRSAVILFGGAGILLFGTLAVIGLLSYLRTTASTDRPEGMNAAATSAPSIVLSSSPAVATSTTPAASASASAAPSASQALVKAPAVPAATPAHTPSARVSPSATPTCHLVSYLDPDGSKHFKQQCDGPPK